MSKIKGDGFTTTRQANFSRLILHIMGGGKETHFCSSTSLLFSGDDISAADISFEALPREVNDSAAANNSSVSINCRHYKCLVV